MYGSVINNKSAKRVFTYALVLGLSACSSSRSTLDPSYLTYDPYQDFETPTGDLADVDSQITGDELFFGTSEDISFVDDSFSDDAFLYEGELAEDLQADAFYYDGQHDLMVDPSPIATVATQSDLDAVESTWAAAPEDIYLDQLASTGRAQMSPIYQSSARSTAWRAEAQRVSKSPFQKSSFIMNAFYFVRSESESWQSLSQSIYGRPDRAELIKEWNGAVALKPGQVLYYNSPSRPEDTQQMKPFALDFGTELEQHRVQAGDSLSLIAKNRYGSYQSWKELSALNPQIANPDLIEIGQTVYLQKPSVDTAAYLAALLAEVEQVAASEQPRQRQDEAMQVQQPETLSAFNNETAAFFENEEALDQIEQEQAAVASTEEPPVARPPPTREQPTAKLRSDATPEQMAAATKTDEAIWFLRAGVLLVAGALTILVIRRIRARRKRGQSEQADLHDFPRTGT